MAYLAVMFSNFYAISLLTLHESYISESTMLTFRFHSKVREEDLQSEHTIP